MTQITAPWILAAAPVCAMLTEAGHQAWFVGGCVRNALLDEPVNDIDISTTAHPETVMALAEAAGLHAIPTGIDHGTVTVVSQGEPYEITTLRRDVETDGRRAVVAFADTLEEDAKRRDFTMNALYARRFKFIEDAEQRIREDYLRILRFFRFHAWYGQDGIDADGLAACAAHVDGIETLSKERIGAEMIKLLSAPDPAPAFASLAATGAMRHILPGAVPDVLAVLVHVEQDANLAPDPIRRLAVIGGEYPPDKLRLSKAQLRQLGDLCETNTDLRTSAYRNGTAVAVDQLAIIAASLGQLIDPADIAIAESAAVQVFPVAAADLMPRFQGRALGDALKDAEARWIASGFTLTKEQLIAEC